MALRKSEEKSPNKPVEETGSTDTTELGSEHEVEQPTTAAEETPAQWKPQKHELYILLTLSIISLMVALDATVIVTSLSVGPDR